MKERRDLDDLLAGQSFELWHALIGAAFLQKRANPVATVILQHNQRADQVGTALAAAGVGPVTKGAALDEPTLSVLDYDRIKPWPLGMQRQPRDRNDCEDRTTRCESLRPVQVPPPSRYRAQSEPARRDTPPQWAASLGARRIRTPLCIRRVAAPARNHRSP